jgi:hypothetical protein
VSGAAAAGAFASGLLSACLTVSLFFLACSGGVQSAQPTSSKAPQVNSATVKRELNTMTISK